MRVAICENDSSAAEYIAEQINNRIHSNAFACDIDFYSSGETFLKNKDDYDIVFIASDLSYPPNKRGIDVAREFRITDEKALIVFLAVCQADVYESFEVNTFRCLMKPIDGAALEKVINGILEYQEKRNNKIVISVDKKPFVMELDRIVYIESAAKHCIIVTPDEQLEISKSISDLQSAIKSLGFFRTHRRFIVNMKYISEIKGSKIVLINGHQCLISRSNLVPFNKAYVSYLGMK